MEPMTDLTHLFLKLSLPFFGQKRTRIWAHWYRTALLVTVCAANFDSSLTHLSLDFSALHHRPFVPH